MTATTALRDTAQEEFNGLIAAFEYEG